MADSDYEAKRSHRHHHHHHHHRHKRPKCRHRMEETDAELHRHRKHRQAESDDEPPRHKKYHLDESEDEPRQEPKQYNKYQTDESDKESYRDKKQRSRSREKEKDKSRGEKHKKEEKAPKREENMEEDREKDTVKAKEDREKDTDKAKEKDRSKEKRKEKKKKKESHRKERSRWENEDENQGSPAGIKQEPGVGQLAPDSNLKKYEEKSGKLAEDTNTYNGIVIKYSEPPEARKPKRRWRLYPFKGEESLPILHIHRQSAFLLGRERRVCDIPIDHPSCSKQHAALQYRLVPFTRPDGRKAQRIRLYIIDLESANGTYVNNQRIEARKYVELLEKDVIKFGFSSREYVLLHEHSKDSEEDDDV